MIVLFHRFILYKQLAACLPCLCDFPFFFFQKQIDFLRSVLRFVKTEIPITIPVNVLAVSILIRRFRLRQFSILFCRIRITGPPEIIRSMRFLPGIIRRTPCPRSRSIARRTPCSRSGTIAPRILASRPRILLLRIIVRRICLRLFRKFLISHIKITDRRQGIVFGAENGNTVTGKILFLCRRRSFFSRMVQIEDSFLTVPFADSVI